MSNFEQLSRGSTSSTSTTSSTTLITRILKFKLPVQFNLKLFSNLKNQNPCLQVLYFKFHGGSSESESETAGQGWALSVAPRAWVPMHHWQPGGPCPRQTVNFEAELGVGASESDETRMGV